MMTFVKRFRNSLRSTSDCVYVARRVIRSEGPMVRLDAHPGHVSASVALTSRGSVALSRLPVVDEAERLARRQRMADYDFSSHS